MIDLGEVPGTASVWCGRLGTEPAYVSASDTTHYAASMMKLAVLVAAHRSREVDLDAPVRVRNDFRSAVGGRFGCNQRHDSDPQVWDRIDQRVPLGWLVERMIVRSSNLATNLVLAEVGMPAVASVWPLVATGSSVVTRGIEDFAADDAGLSNLVTAADLAALLSAIAAGARTHGPIGTTEQCQAMLETLFGQRHREDLAAGLPPGTRVAYKNAWIRGVRHAAGIVYPDDAPPFVLAVCLTSPLAVNKPGDAACQLIAQVAAAAWSERHTL